MSASELADTIRDAGIIVVDGQRVVTTTERDMIVAALRPADVSGGERERIARAFEAGALAVHKEWVAASDREEGPPRGDPDFSEAANDYAADAILARQPSRDNSREE